jgi:hypothetical protein
MPKTPYIIARKVNVINEYLIIPFLLKEYMNPTANKNVLTKNPIIGIKIT